MIIRDFYNESKIFTLSARDRERLFSFYEKSSKEILALRSLLTIPIPPFLLRKTFLPFVNPSFKNFRKEIEKELVKYNGSPLIDFVEGLKRKDKKILKKICKSCPVFFSFLVHRHPFIGVRYHYLAKQFASKYRPFIHPYLSLERIRVFDLTSKFLPAIVFPYPFSVNKVSFSLQKKDGKIRVTLGGGLDMWAKIFLKPVVSFLKEKVSKDCLLVGWFETDYESFLRNILSFYETGKVDELPIVISEFHVGSHVGKGNYLKAIKNATKLANKLSLKIAVRTKKIWREINSLNELKVIYPLILVSLSTEKRYLVFPEITGETIEIVDRVYRNVTGLKGEEFFAHCIPFFPSRKEGNQITVAYTGESKERASFLRWRIGLPVILKQRSLGTFFLKKIRYDLL